MAAQREEINKLKETIQEDLVTTNQRIDSLMTDLVLIPPEGSEPPKKKRKLSVNITSATSGAATGNSVCDPVSRSADDLNSVPDTEQRDRGKSPVSAAEGQTNTAADANSAADAPPTLLSRLSEKFTQADSSGPPVSEGLANIINNVIRERGPRKEDEKKRNRVLEKNLRPENCSSLPAPRVNKEIWGPLMSGTRTPDIEYQKTQNALLRAIGPLANVIDMIIKDDPNGENSKMSSIVDNLMESIRLISFANDDINHLRRSNIKSDLSSEYKSLCSSQNPVNASLFGDNIADQLKSIQDANKVGKKIGGNNPFLGSRPSWHRGAGRGRRGWGR